MGVPGGRWSSIQEEASERLSSRQHAIERHRIEERGSGRGERETERQALTSGDSRGEVPRGETKRSGHPERISSEAGGGDRGSGVEQTALQKEKRAPSASRRTKGDVSAKAPRKRTPATRSPRSFSRMERPGRPAPRKTRGPSARTPVYFVEAAGPASPAGIRNVGREVGLAYVPIGDGEEEGGEKPDLAGEETASEESEEENRPDSEKGGEHTAQETRCNGLGSEAKKHRVEVGKQSGIVVETRIRVGRSQRSLRVPTMYSSSGRTRSMSSPKSMDQSRRPAARSGRAIHPIPVRTRPCGVETA
jgi:hypothetical protein